LPDGKSRDAGVTAYVQRLIATDPVTALEWAQTIGNQNTRTTQLETVVSAWMKTNPDDASSWVTQSSLSSDVKARLLPQTQ
jgi:hypothetical protein